MVSDRVYVRQTSWQTIGYKTMKSDVSRRSFAFVSGMTFPFDVAILNIPVSSS